MAHTKTYLIVRGAVRSVFWMLAVGVPTTGVLLLDALWQV